MTINPSMRRAYDVVRECKRTILPQLAKSWGLTFEQQSYNKWAINELMNRLCNNPEVPPLITMEGFLHELDGYSTMNPIASYPFSTARDMVQWTIDLLLV